MYKKLFYLIVVTLCFSLSSHAQMCELMLNKKGGDILASIEAQPGLKATLNLIRNKLKDDKQLKSPVKVSKKMQEFREKYLPYLKINRRTREGIIRWMEAELRISSLATKQKLLDSKKEEQYDVVIVGAGIHGIIALHELLRVNPKLKVLIVESSDTGASNFRYAGDTFNLNSSTRPSGKNSKPLPGKGNINELARNPIQVSDLSANKYPTANDLSSALIAGLYAEVEGYPNVDISFDTKAKKTSKKDSRFGAKLSLDIKDRGNTYSTSVTAQQIFFATGLGASRIPEGIEESFKKYPELVETTRDFKKLPKVLTYVDLLKILAQEPNPVRFFKNKRIGLAGTGDSGNTTLEFLLGFSSPGAYGFSDAQTKGARRVVWFGQSQKTCEEYIAKARSRYAMIGTGFRSSDPSKKPILKGEKRKALAVKPVDGELEVRLEGDRYEYVDHLILATGVENELFKVLKSLIDSSRVNSFKTSKEFLDEYFSFLEGTTEISKDKKVRIARILSKKDSDFAVIGTAAEGLPKESELLGIIQNSVSIFNNAPRVLAAVKKLGRDIKPRAKNTYLPAVDDDKVKKVRGTVEVTNLSPIRSLDEINEFYLQEALKSTLGQLDLKNMRDSEVSIKFYNTKKGIVISSNLPDRPFSALIRLLVTTRDFFNTVKLLVSTPGMNKISVEIPFKRNSRLKMNKMTFDYSDSSRVPEARDTIKNTAVTLDDLKIK